VQVVGYDNDRQAWLYKQSWGPGFAMGGFAWVAYKAPGVCDRQYTFGLTFIPDQQVWPPIPLQPAPSRPGCFLYTAQPGDSAAGLAARLGLDTKGLTQLLADNVDSVRNPGKLPPGALIRVCGITRRMQPAAPASTPVGPPPAAAAAAAAGAKKTSTRADSPNKDG
jgi:hypothetical protein